MNTRHSMYKYIATPEELRERDNAWLQVEHQRDKLKRDQEERMWNEHDREGK